MTKGFAMRYILKNKDIDILTFEISQDLAMHNGALKQRTILKKITQIINPHLLPRAMSDSSINALEKWLRKRQAPQHREFAHNIFKTIDSADNLMAFLDISLALSLNDSFWIIPADRDYKWCDYNLYDNTFDESLQRIAFGANPHKMTSITLSPEYTTDGMLPKCWVRENGDIYLYKGSSKMNDGADEPYSEYYMAQIAGALGFAHIAYDLGEFCGNLVSSCAIFTNENEGYLPIYHCLEPSIIKSHKANLINPIVKIYGEKDFEDLMLFDALICNTDRHLGNFGMIIDNNTNAILRPAPIFDNGLSVMTLFDENNTSEVAHLTSFFELNLNEQLKRFAKPRHIPHLEKLKDFSFTKHKNFNINDKWLESTQRFIQNRANLALRFASNK